MSNLSINTGTQAAINFDLNGTVNTQVVGIGYGTVSSLGTLPNIPGGTINVATISGNISIPSGTINVGTFVGNGGSMIAYGAAAAAAAAAGNPVNIGGTDAGGTIRTIKVDSGGLQRIGLDSGTVSVLPDLPGGSIIQTAGTQSVGTVNTGTINVATVSAGTVNVATVTAGTINAGTFRPDARTTQNMVSYGTQMAFSAGTQGTVIGSASAGAGTFMWINDFSLINPAGTAMWILGFGTAQQGTNVLFRGVLGTQTTPGIEKSFAMAVNAGMMNQDLVLATTGVGTVDLSVSYFFSV